MDKQISAVLDELATRFGSTGAHLWEQLVRYRVAMDVTTAVLLVAATVVAGIFFKRVYKADEYHDSPEVFLLGIVLGLGVIFSVIAAVCAIATLAAPEAATIHALLK